MNTPVYADQEWRDFIDEFVGEAALNQLRATFEAAKISESMEPPRQHSPRCRMSRSWRRKCSCEATS